VEGPVALPLLSSGQPGEVRETWRLSAGGALMKRWQGPSPHSDGLAVTLTYRPFYVVYRFWVMSYVDVPTGLSALLAQNQAAIVKMVLGRLRLVHPVGDEER
jgi:hypothetical protein